MGDIYIKKKNGGGNGWKISDDAVLKTASAAAPVMARLYTHFINTVSKHMHIHPLSIYIHSYTLYIQVLPPIIPQDNDNSYSMTPLCACPLQLEARNVLVWNFPETDVDCYYLVTYGSHNGITALKTSSISSYKDAFSNSHLHVLHIAGSGLFPRRLSAIQPWSDNLPQSVTLLPSGANSATVHWFRHCQAEATPNWIVPHWQVLHYGASTEHLPRQLFPLAKQSVMLAQQSCAAQWGGIQFSQAHSYKFRLISQAGLSVNKAISTVANIGIPTDSFSDIRPFPSQFDPVSDELYKTESSRESEIKAPSTWADNKCFQDMMWFMTEVCSLISCYMWRLIYRPSLILPFLTRRISRCLRSAMELSWCGRDCPQKWALTQNLHDIWVDTLQQRHSH